MRGTLVDTNVLLDVLTFAQEEGFGLKGLVRSPVLGPKGNIEFLAWLCLYSTDETVDSLVEKVIPKDEEDEMP